MSTETRIDDDGLPTIPGVYVIREGRLGGDEQVQLDHMGHWWPYPYMFSGWREGELRVMGGIWYRLDDVALDVPEIRNPEREARVNTLVAELVAAFPEISDERERLVVFARTQVLDEYDLVG